MNGMLDEGGEGCQKAEKQIAMPAHQVTNYHQFCLNPVAVDYTAFLFIYTFYLAEHNLINRTGILATVVSHCCVIQDILKCIQIPSKLL